MGRRFPIRFLALLVLVVPFAVAAPPPPDASRGVHDPSIIEFNKSFYLFSTGNGLQVRTSTDLVHWTRAGKVFNDIPAWAKPYTKNNQSLWAPDISKSHDQFRVYYAASTFGSTHSGIGLATNTTLDRTDAAYRWVDRGMVVDTPADHDWNALDPCAFDDADGHSWLVLGSCWTGIKLLPLNSETGLLKSPDAKPISIAGRPGNHIIEEGYVRRHGDFYYLWVSVDYCCRRADSTYKILVGRSKSVTGPYKDRDGRPMTDGGGTLVLSSYDTVRGPGSCAVLDTNNHEYLVHHFYDKAHNGDPAVQTRPLLWDADGWPIAAEPITQPINDPAPAKTATDGTWQIDTDFGDPSPIELNSDGKITGGGTWSVINDRLKLEKPRQGRTDWAVATFLSPDGKSFVGRDNDGAVARGRR